MAKLHTTSTAPLPLCTESCTGFCAPGEKVVIDRYEAAGYRFYLKRVVATDFPNPGLVES